MYRVNHKGWDFNAVLKCDQKSKELSLYHNLKFSNLLNFANDGEYVLYLKFRLLDLTEFKFLNIYGLRHQAAKI